MSLKKKIKIIFDPFIKALVANKLSWKVVAIFLRIAEWFRFNRSQYEHTIADKRLSIYLADKTVQNGFFKGLKYPSFKSYGSSVYPKLIGSYESELYATLLKLKEKVYSEIIDVGCAEGFYAVGLALKFPEATVYAYDVDKHALEYCKLMALENKVTERIILGSLCSAETIKNFRFTRRGLIICDCEGYERELFNCTNVGNLKLTDMIIELHTFVHTDVKDYLINLFTETHYYSIVSSHDNSRKIHDFKP